MNAADLRFVVHVGDILWFPCSDHAFRDRLARINAIRHPVMYTPGDNEWTDCHEQIAGGYRPLERLERLRTIFFATPGRTLGGTPATVEPQSEDPAFPEYVENVRWRVGGFLFATLHLVGADNATEPFDGRTAADDDEARRRTEAALAWLGAAFDLARADRLHGVVIAFHANPGLEAGPEPRPGYGPLLEHLGALTEEYAGEVLLIHGDSHTQRVDHPLHNRRSGEPLRNFTRLETYGSPNIGWVRVVADSTAGRFLAFEPRRIPARLLW
jgi:hypothetical protein